MGKLRPNYTKTGIIQVGQTSITIPINVNNSELVWVVEQIAVSYSVGTDAPQVTVVRNGTVFSGAAQMLKGSAGLSQTFAGQPFLYMENSDVVNVAIVNGTAGANVTIQFQHRVIGYDDPELEGRF